MLVSFNTEISNPNFQRKPGSSQMKKYTKTVNEGLKVLDKNLGLIVHNSSVPSAYGKNQGIGSLLSKNAELAFIPFLVANGISTIQQEPDNLRSTYVPSPYSPISPAKNIYMIPLERLADNEYGNLVDKEDIQKIIDKNAESNSPNTVNYTQIAKDYDEILTKAYNNLIFDDHVLINDFEEFIFKKSEELEPSAIYEVLAKKYNNENWRNWPEAERNLYMNNDRETLETIREENRNEIDFFMFKQWLVEREIEKANYRNETLGIKVIGDSPVAWTPVEEWMNQDLFMDGLALGCPPDYFAKNGQRWGFSVLKPETIFNPDGSLGKGGELMRKKYEKMFEASPGGARIDHVIGLIDPFVYSTREPKMNSKNSGRLYSSPNHPILDQYARKNIEEYSAILEKIVIPAAEKYGLSKDDIICEDLGTVTPPVLKVMKKLKLGGIAVTEFDHRGKHQKENKTIMLGSHDNPSFIQYTKSLFNDKKKLNTKATKLANDTALPNQDTKAYRDELKKNPVKFMAAAFLELFTSPAKKVQIFFTDFFGIGRTYNQPGKKKDCWTLRVPENFDKYYWENVKKGKAINLPETIANAIRHRGEDFASKHQDLLGRLDEMAKLLKD